jgi:hypothetical protein
VSRPGIRPPRLAPPAGVYWRGERLVGGTTPSPLEGGGGGGRASGWRLRAVPLPLPLPQRGQRLNPTYSTLRLVLPARSSRPDAAAGRTRAVEARG